MEPGGEVLTDVINDWRQLGDWGVAGGWDVAWLWSKKVSARRRWTCCVVKIRIFYVFCTQISSHRRAERGAEQGRARTWG